MIDMPIIGCHVWSHALRAWQGYWNYRINVGKNFIDIFYAYELRNKIIAYVKNEASNLNTMTSVFKYIVKCGTLSFEESFQGTCFGPFLSKAYQYVMINEKV
jgi:hypothetical protein